MNKEFDKLEVRLGRLGQRLAEQPSIVDRVMIEVERAEPVRTPRFNQRRIATMLLKPRNLAAAAAMVALVFFGLSPWGSNHENGAAAWWLAPPSAWAGDLHAAIDNVSQQRFSCREQFINLTEGGSRATSSTTNRLFVCGDRYRRDIFDQNRLRETQWYVHSPEGLTMTCGRVHDKTYTTTHDPKARQTDDDPMRRIEALARLLEESGRRIGTSRVDERDAVEFEIEAKKIDPQDDDAMIHVWLDQTTKLPLKITYQFAAHGGQGQQGQVVTTILVQDRFEWNPALPANTFDPQIPTGDTQGALQMGQP
jgi:hypothetical protein